VGVLVESALLEMAGLGCRSLAGVCLNGPLGIGKRYAAGVFHNWSKEARGQQASRFVHLWKDRLTAAVG
jgi:DNA-binding NtrC family response regulator